jgi:hypothetical protein
VDLRVPDARRERERTHRVRDRDPDGLVHQAVVDSAQAAFAADWLVGSSRWGLLDGLVERSVAESLVVCGGDASELDVDEPAGRRVVREPVALVRLDVPRLELEELTEVRVGLLAEAPVIKGISTLVMGVAILLGLLTAAMRLRRVEPFSATVPT